MLPFKIESVENFLTQLWKWIADLFPKFVLGDSLSHSNASKFFFFFSTSAFSLDCEFLFIPNIMLPWEKVESQHSKIQQKLENTWGVLNI